MITKSAIVSPCGTFRYEWRRAWNRKLPPFLAVLLNPSTADACVEDATSIRIWKRADACGCGSAIIANLGAGRATDPNDWMAMRDPIGPDNNEYLREVMREVYKRGGVALAGWGVHGGFMKRNVIVSVFARRIGLRFGHLGLTKLGYPKHPLYVSAKTPIREF